MSMLDVLLLQCERANEELVEELKRLYPNSAKFTANMQPASNRPHDVVRIVDVVEDRPGFLRVMYEGGHTSTIHCRQIVGPA